MKLYRAMTPAKDGLPVVARSARALGVRTPREATNTPPDVTATDPSDIIQPGTGGMSASPNDTARPMALAEFERALAATRAKWVRHTG